MDTIEYATFRYRRGEVENGLKKLSQSFLVTKNHYTIYNVNNANVCLTLVTKKESEILNTKEYEIEQNNCHLTNS